MLLPLLISSLKIARLTRPCTPTIQWAWLLVAYRFIGDYRVYTLYICIPSWQAALPRTFCTTVYCIVDMYKINRNVARPSWEQIYSEETRPTLLPHHTLSFILIDLNNRKKNVNNKLKYSVAQKGIKCSTILSSRGMKEKFVYSLVKSAVLLEHVRHQNELIFILMRCSSCHASECYSYSLLSKK